MRVLAIVNNFPWPGDIDGIFNLRQLSAVQNLGHEVRVIRWLPWTPLVRKRWKRYADIPSSYSIGGLAVRTVVAAMPPRSFALWALAWQTRRALATEVADFAPDVVHVHGLIPAGVLAVGLGVPYVVTGHGSETYKLPWLRSGLQAVAKKVIAGAGACAAVSDFVASNMRKLGASDVHVIFNGADDTVFVPLDRSEQREKFGLDRDRPTIGFAGHVVPAKGVSELQAAILRVADLHPQCIIAGEGPLKAPLRDALAAAEIPTAFTGVLGHDDLASLMGACDVFVLPSHAEGLPTTLSEAMSCGRAIVATEAGGIPEIVRDGETGYVVPIGDVTALTDRIRKILKDPELRTSMESAALRFAQDRLTWDRNARAYEEIYVRISAGRAPAASNASSTFL